MKKYRWNKGRFAITVLKLEGIIFTALLFDAMFIYALLK